MPVSQHTKDKALKALDGLEQIARNEMLVRGEYIDENVDAEKQKQGAVCGGRRACLIGSLWIGYGVKPKTDKWGGLDLPGVYNQKRFVARRPGLKLAWEALNQAAARRYKRAGVELRQLEGPAEELFELGLDGNEDETHPPDRPGVLRLVRSARKIVEAA